MSAFANVGRPLVAMVHLPPLPGAANYDGTPVGHLADQAAAEAKLLGEAGFDGVMIQNTHDRPSRITAPPATIAALAAIGSQVREIYDGELGVNIHKNDAVGAIAVAHACGASFVRIKVLVGAVVGPEGLIEGAAEVVQDARLLAPALEIWADLHELTSWPVAPVPLGALADLAVRFGGADRLIVTEPSVDASAAAITEIRASTTTPSVIGGRTSPETAAAALAASDGLIVGTCLRQQGRTTSPLDEQAVRSFLAAARR